MLLDQVCKSFGDKQVLKDISLRVPYGSIYGLLGPSGCGKTTTVKIIAGIMEASSGDTSVLGVKMPNLSVMGSIGYMAQSDALYNVMSAAENLEFFASLYGYKKNEIKKRIVEVAALVNLSKEVQKPVSAYSGGMKRRLSLAMAIFHHPKVVNMDELTFGIDLVLRKYICDELYNNYQEGIISVDIMHIGYKIIEG